MSYFALPFTRYFVSCSRFMPTFYFFAVVIFSSIYAGILMVLEKTKKRS